MKNITIKFVLDNRALSNGKHTVFLRIINERKRKLISLSLQCKLEHFKNESFTKQHPNHQIENEILLKFKVKALKIVREFQINQIDFTNEEFEEALKGKKSTNLSVFDFFKEIIDEMERSGRIGNARAYKETYNALKLFTKKTLRFKEITPSFLEKFEVHLRENGNQDGGIAFKMRELRAIYNKAINRDLVGQETYPFKKYKISKLKAKTRKRALTIEDFKKFKNFNVEENPILLEAYHYFLFSFYTRGMNFVDMMLLKWTDIQNDRIYYERSKTKGQFSIEIINEVKIILDYYKSLNPNSTYVFPILLKDNLTPIQIANRKHKVLQRYNDKLKQIALLVGIETKLTSYVARHSFATILKQKGTSTDLISELMGHSDVQITMTYLKEFDNDTLDKANRELSNL